MRPGLLHPLRDPPRAGIGLRHLPGARLLLTAFFDDAYRRILAPFHPESEARYETGALRELLGLSQSDRILDLGCGWGRHLRLLRRAGHDVTGVDLSPALLRHVRRDDPDACLVAGNMLDLPFASDSFDVALNLATSLGLFLTDPPAVQALAEARRVIRPDGVLLLEGMHRDDVVCAYASRDSWTLDDGTEVRARRRFDAVRGVSHEVLRWREPDGSTRTKRHSLRLRSATEHLALLATAGFRVIDTWGDWDTAPFVASSPRLLVLAAPADAS